MLLIFILRHRIYICKHTCVYRVINDITMGHICLYLYYTMLCMVFPSNSVKNLPAMQETQVDPMVGKIPWRREWQYIPIFFPGEFHGQRSLAGYIPRGHKESDMTQWLTFSLSLSLCNLTSKSHISVFAPKRRFIVQLTHKYLRKFCSINTFVQTQKTDTSLGNMWKVVNQNSKSSVFIRYFSVL